MSETCRPRLSEDEVEIIQRLVYLEYWKLRKEIVWRKKAGATVPEEWEEKLKKLRRLVKKFNRLYFKTSRMFL